MCLSCVRSQSNVKRSADPELILHRRQHHDVSQVTYFREVTVQDQEQGTSFTFSLEDPSHCPLVWPFRICLSEAGCCQQPSECVSSKGAHSC